MADENDLEAIAALRKKRTFKKFTFRGLELEKILDLSNEELLAIVNARARRRLQRGTSRKGKALMNKLAKAKKACGPLDRPAPVKTHLRDLVIVPDMIGSQVAVYNGEYSISYRPVRHGRPGLGSTNSSRFIPLK